MVDTLANQYLIINTNLQNLHHQKCTVSVSSQKLQDSRCRPTQHSDSNSLIIAKVVGTQLNDKINTSK